MTRDDYSQLKIREKNKRARLAGSFSKTFADQTTKQREAVLARKAKLRKLIKAGVTNIEQLAEEVSASVSTIKKDVHKMGFVTEMGEVI